jgi:hypothetical protein
MGDGAIEIEPYYTDIEVATILDPKGNRIRARSIRSEREAGRLTGTRVAGKWLYRKSDVLAFLEAARCPDQTSVPDFAPSKKRGGPGDFSTSLGQNVAEPSCTERASMPVILTRLPSRKHTSETGCESGHGRGKKAPPTLSKFGSPT